MKRILLASLFVLLPTLLAVRAFAAADAEPLADDAWPVAAVAEGLAAPGARLDAGERSWLLWEVPGPFLETLGLDSLALPADDLEAASASHVDPAVDKVESEWLHDGVKFRVTTYKEPKETVNEHLARHKATVTKAKHYFPPDDPQ